MSNSRSAPEGVAGVGEDADTAGAGGIPAAIVGGMTALRTASTNSFKSRRFMDAYLSSGRFSFFGPIVSQIVHFGSPPNTKPKNVPLRSPPMVRNLSFH